MRSSSLSCALLGAALLALCPSRASAQTSVPVPYQLDQGSAYITGCYPPCFCPVLANPWLNGSFTLQYQLTDTMGFDHYAVQGVDWFVGIGPGADHVTGQGTYVRGMFSVLLERLELDLSLNGAQPQHFDSGFVEPVATFPDLDISIAVNGFVCQDTVYHLVASVGAPGVAFCSGDGTATACPCGNAGGAGRGCASSVDPSGSSLTATGYASIASDAAQLRSSGTPDSSLLFYQGTQQFQGGAGAVFGDGLRCVGGPLVRLKTVIATGGAATIPASGDPTLSQSGGITAPGVYTYQVWYRNAAPFCTPSTFNLSNGLEVTWLP